MASGPPCRRTCQVSSTTSSSLSRPSGPQGNPKHPKPSKIPVIFAGNFPAGNSRDHPLAMRTQQDLQLKQSTVAIGDRTSSMLFTAESLYLRLAAGPCNLLQVGGGPHSDVNFRETCLGRPQHIMRFVLQSTPQHADDEVLIESFPLGTMQTSRPAGEAVGSTVHIQETKQSINQQVYMYICLDLYLCVFIRLRMYLSLLNTCVC